MFKHFFPILPLYQKIATFQKPIILSIRRIIRKHFFFSLFMMADGVILIQIMQYFFLKDVLHARFPIFDQLSSIQNKNLFRESPKHD
jgi:hypothetical protein